MKRFRVLPFFDFDTRVHTLTLEIKDEWDERTKALHVKNRENAVLRLQAEFGELNGEVKLQNFIDLGAKNPSILAFHNQFFAQIRTAFVVGSYYPALTGACALGERILNHLILTLRDDFRHTEQYRRICRKESFDDWSLAINTLEAWGVLLPQVVAAFKSLMLQRHRAIHFRPETDVNSRELALEAIKTLHSIVVEQFSGWGTEPWFITNIPGEIYIRKDWEQRPFIAKIYQPNAALVSYRHQLKQMAPLLIVEPEKMSEQFPLSDEEFASLRIEFNRNGQQL